MFVFVAQRTPTEEDTLMAQFDGLSVLGGKPELRSPLTVANRHSQKKRFPQRWRRCGEVSYVRMPNVICLSLRLRDSLRTRNG